MGTNTHLLSYPLRMGAVCHASACAGVRRLQRAERRGRVWSYRRRTKRGAKSRPLGGLGWRSQPFEAFVLQRKAEFPLGEAISFTQRATVALLLLLILFEIALLRFRAYLTTSGSLSLHYSETSLDRTTIRSQLPTNLRGRAAVGPTLLGASARSR
jgi:hypothetical protein